MSAIEVLTELHSVLRVYCSNFSVLHWNSVGEEFNDAHKNITTDYEDKFHDAVDPVGEYITRLGANPLNYAETLEFLNNSESKYLVVSSKQLYTRAEIIKLTQAMLCDTCRLFVKALDDEEINQTVNASIKSDLESLYNVFDLEFRYINARRIATIATPAAQELAEEEPIVDED